MSLASTTQLDHGHDVLSTAPSAASERANLVRYRAELAGGHVESHFLKANSPDGKRAIWIKHTLLSPIDAGTPRVAELWATAFAERGAAKSAHKVSYPLAEATLSSAPFRFALPGAELRTGAARGSAADLHWDLRFDASAPPFLPFRSPRMYTGAFPRSKSLTPVPDTRVFGTVHAFGETWQLDGWRGAQGHNWGVSHAQAYAWLHCNALSREPGGALDDGVWVEALTGKVRLGGVLSPFMSVAGMQVDGQRLRFDGLSALLARSVEVYDGRYVLRLEQAGATLLLHAHAAPARFAGLRYQDPDGSSLTCLNTKLAQLTVELRVRKQTRRWFSDQAALEIGTRRHQDRVPVLA